ncbi:MAG TPA: gamma-glutamylcyclotransferase, partial [Nannocystis sp.]
GRVVTVVPEPGARCHGVAYRVAPEVAERVIADLDHRERGGYASVTLDVELLGGPAPERARARMYLATPDNPHYLGPAPVDAIAGQILRSHGPSGPNAEYLLRLADALRELEAEDDHVFTLERTLRALQAGLAAG